MPTRSPARSPLVPTVLSERRAAAAALGAGQSSRRSQGAHVRGQRSLVAVRLDLSPDELLTTTRAVRKRLDFSRPVERSVVEECLNIALQAPSGSNRQTWQWVVVEDPDRKKAVAEQYAAGFQLYRNMPPAAYADGDSRGERQDAVRS